MSVFAVPALEEFKALYPETPGLLRHQLGTHPLLELEALVALAQRMRPCDAEYNRADLPIGVDPADTPDNGLSAEATIRSIEENGSWMVLKFIEQDPAYRALLDEILDVIAPVVSPVTGKMLKREGFIFISSPGAVTPFHFDPEHNILMQLRGTKRMTVLPAGDPRFAAPIEHERFHAGGHRNLPWDNDFAASGDAFTLKPGDALYVPVKAPHWVQNGDAVSISLSVTWRSEWSYEEAYAHGFNAMTRRYGVEPAQTARYPRRNSLKSFAYRAIRKLQDQAGMKRT